MTAPRSEPGWLLRARLAISEPDFPELCVLAAGLAAILIVLALE